MSTDNDAYVSRLIDVMNSLEDERMRAEDGETFRTPAVLEARIQRIERRLAPLVDAPF